MSDVKWTVEQLQAIESKGTNILVAAAAGSGKTAVLVERIIRKIINEKIDIDKMLVVTFTNAAASEMREKILEAIYKKLEENPENVHLQKQITLLNKASICTIHSFCLDVIRNYFYELDLPSNFKIADTAEIDLLKQEVIDDLFEQKYTENDNDFLDLLETYTGYRGDEPLQELVLSIYRFIQSSPFPEKWLQESLEEFNINENEDFSHTTWGNIILQEVKEELEECSIKLETLKDELAKWPECNKFYQVLNEDIMQIKFAIDKADSWDKMYKEINEISFTKWPVDKKVTLSLKEEAKEARDKVKKVIKEKVAVLINEDSKEIATDFEKTYPILKKLQNLILEFSKCFAEKKKERNCIDFNDIEHFALKILLDENGNKTNVAKKYEDKFEEIAIDEYQDSNLVQEAILNSISKGNNIFMVGDVKQSIYKFRQARPELFLQKYESYKNKDELEQGANLNEIQNNNKNNVIQISDENEDNIVKKESLTEENKQDNLKIQLFRNFRSRTNILDVTNLIFETIMSKSLGDIDYNENEYLNYGANYPEPEEKQTNSYAGTAELDIINLKQDETIMAIKDNNVENANLNDIKLENINQKNITSENTENEENLERIEDDILEARFVAKRIQELLDSKYQVYDRKKGYRNIEPKDIVILLRATSSLAPIYEKELSDLNLPVFSDSSTSYLESSEIETILSVLKVIDNPMQDIPLVVVLRSIIGNFTDNELVSIRLTDRNCNFYEALIKTRISCEEPLKTKIEKLLEKLDSWRKQSEYMPLDELIWQIYLNTGYYQYVGLLPNGAMRQANLKTLFERAKQYETASFKGLFHFIQFIEKLKKQNGDLTSAKLIGENSNVIRIMSIHKSKGLEFPVVFLCNTQKKFNLKDLNDVILLDQDLGFGPTFIDKDKRIKYNTIAKQAIGLKVKKETLAEEERILYVALTRAKEKLIITGRSKDINKDLQEKQNNLSMYLENDNFENNNFKDENFKIDSKLIRKCNSYLDWIEYVYMFYQNRQVTLKANKMNLSDVIELKTFEKDKLVKELQKHEKEQENLHEKILEEVRKQKEDTEELQKLKQTLDWKYDYEIDVILPTKTSVTKLKQEQKNKLPSVKDRMDWEELESEENDNLGNSNLKIEENSDIEKFDVKTEKNDIKNSEEVANKSKYIKWEPLVSESEKSITAAKKGTLIHLCIQKMDEQKDYTKEDIQNMIDKLVEDEIITNIEAKAINQNMLYAYTQSDLFKELRQAKQVHKEQPFYINIPAKEIFEEAKIANSNKNILIQGIIDLYYIDKNNDIHLIDYKTDYIQKGHEYKLQEKYKIQLDLYSKALEQALGRKVKTARIFSLYNLKLNKENQ